MEQLQLDFPRQATDGDLPLGRLRRRLDSRDVFALLSKRRAVKDEFVDMLQEKHDGQLFVYLCPKAIRDYIRERYPDMIVEAIEQFTKRDKYLRLNDYMSDETVVVMENVARYARLKSDKFRYLHRFRKQTTYRYWLDVVPFTQEICKLYLPLSYLTRDILGYPNGYAFEHNYLEEDDRGNERRAHDPAFLAEKLAPHAYIDYDAFLPSIECVDTTLTDEENVRYAKKKAALFEKWNSPRKIVTALADFANIFETRYDALAELIERLDGSVVIFTNLTGHNRRIRRALRKRKCTADVSYHTYTTHDNRPIDAAHVVFFETPINQNRMAALDVLADVRGTVYHFRSDANVDRFVFGEANDEWQAIDALTRALYLEQTSNA